MADVLVTDVSGDGTKTYTTLLFQEYAKDGSPLPPKRFTIEGNEAHLDAMVIKFQGKYVEANDPLRGRSIALFTKLFDDKHAPEKGYVIDEPGHIPAVYKGSDPKVSEFEQQLWRDFWKLAQDKAYREQMGVDVLQGKSLWWRFEPGFLYTVTLQADADLNLRYEPLKGIYKEMLKGRTDAADDGTSVGGSPKHEALPAPPEIRSTKHEIRNNAPKRKRRNSKRRHRGSAGAVSTFLLRDFGIVSGFVLRISIKGVLALSDPLPLKPVEPSKPAHGPTPAPAWVALLAAWCGLIVLVCAVVFVFLPGSRNPTAELEHAVPYSAKDRFLPVPIYGIALRVPGDRGPLADAPRAARSAGDGRAARPGVCGNPAGPRRGGRRVRVRGAVRAETLTSRSPPHRPAALGAHAAARAGRTRSACISPAAMPTTCAEPQVDPERHPEICRPRATPRSRRSTAGPLASPADALPCRRL